MSDSKLIAQVLAEERERLAPAPLHERPARHSSQGFVEVLAKKLPRRKVIVVSKASDQLRFHYAHPMPDRIMYVQLKTGHALDAGPAWISRVRFTKTWKTVYFHGRTLAREHSWDANFRDVDTDEWFWLSGPKRDRSDARYGHGAPTIDDDARADYEAFLDGAPLPGREHG